MFGSGGNDGKHGWRAQEHAGDEGQRVGAMLRVELMPARLHDLAEGLARVALPQDEAPGGELAVVRHARGEAEDLGQLGRGGPRLRHRLGGG
jgi:hypothetical protein